MAQIEAYYGSVMSVCRTIGSNVPVKLAKSLMFSLLKLTQPHIPMEWKMSTYILGAMGC